jgi:hypothetical protein
VVHRRSFISQPEGGTVLELLPPKPVRPEGFQYANAMTIKRMIKTNAIASPSSRSLSM